MPSINPLRPLLPSYLAKNSLPSPSPTSHLTSLRGLASLLVFSHHLLYQYHRWYDAGYGRGPGSSNTRLIQLPFLCLSYAGPAMVCVFYVVSGVVLSLGPLGEAEERGGGVRRCRARVVRAVLRRPLRLVGPPGVVSLGVVACLRMGAYGYSIAHHGGWAARGSKEPRPPVMESWAEQLGHWMGEVLFTLGNPFYTTMDPPKFAYDVHLWTIPAELRYSLLLLGLLYGTAGMSARGRAVVALGLSVLCWWIGCWEGILFLAGLVISQTIVQREGRRRHVHQRIGSLPKALVPIQVKQERKTSSLSRASSYLLFVVALFLLSAPTWDQQSTPGFRELSRMSPSWWGYEKFRFLHVLGSIALVAAVSENDRLRAFFSNRPSLYLGRISYGLYMAHGPIIHMLGDRIIPYLWQWTNGPVQEVGKGAGSVYKGGTAMGYEMGFLLGGAVVVLCSLHVADLITRLIDEPIVRLCRQIEWKSSSI